MAGIGAYLRQARERQGYTLEQMNSSTNIHTEYLNALENDRFDQLPSPFYAKAFLRTYAKCLGLDARPLLDYFEKTVLGKTEEPAQPTVQPAPQPRATFGPNNIKPVEAKQDSFALPQGQPLRQTQPQSLLNKKTKPQDQQTTRTVMPVSMQQGGHVQQTPMQPRAAQSMPPRAMTPPQLQSMTPQAQPPTPLPPSQPQQPTPSLEMTQTLRSNLPNLQQTMQHQPLAPRRIALESKSEGRKDKKPLTWVLPVAIGALLLVGGTLYFTVFQPESDTAGGNVDKNVADSVDHSVRADGQNTVYLEEGGTSDNPLEGQLYYVRNANKLEVKLKGRDGESTVSFAPTAKDTPQEFTLKVGEEKTLEIGNQNQVWFRLGTPSNVEVTANGQTINTSAQDTEKSYRVQLKK
ncbi:MULTISPECIES: helix-turn-helix domain-containing protein [Laceyella]|uniref:Helix-turn-helix protein n=1 Tax=Laceyella sediminis TaxID=573074 RepID=A0ABX5ES65_9BACL|nr:helix-turn-helix transcriptional regulator [Laceyella sediminis]MRG29060.1 hypothetical protein [Laceyella tengchongensis]PRZ15495.1 helix-turn-helix protein [Laceyella sediminis]